MSIVPEYTRYPGIDENNNFPPPVRQAIAESDEVEQTVAASPVIREAMANSSENLTAIQASMNAAFAPQGIVDDKLDALRAQVDQLKDPAVIAQRAASKVYPENSFEGIESAVRNDFSPHVVVRFLAGDIPVAITDATVNRTMTGIPTGNVDEKTYAQWKLARIKNPVTGGNTGRPVTIMELLDKFSGRALLVFELPATTTPEQVTILSEMILSRGLRRAVLLISTDPAVRTQLMDMGIECAFDAGVPVAGDGVILYSEGVRWIVVNKTTTSAVMTALATAGLNVLVRDISTKQEAGALPADVKGYLSDDPWASSRRLQILSVPEWKTGNAWPLRRIYGSFTTTTYSDRTDTVQLEGSNMYVGNYDNALGRTFIDLQHLTGGEPITRPIVITVRATVLRRAATQQSGYGIVVYKNTADPEANFQEGAKAGQHGLQFYLRRDSGLGITSYVNGGAGTALVSEHNLGTALAGSSRSFNASLRVELTSSFVGFNHVETNRLHTFNTAVPDGNLIPLLYVFGSEVLIQDVAIEKYRGS